MKNIVCPVSAERIYDTTPRVTALFVIILLVSYALTLSWLIPSFLVVDFYIRGFGKGKYSLLAIISNKIAETLPNKGKLINKAPKLFAARLGFVFTSSIVVLHLIGLPTIATSISIMLILFAGLECLANFCVGCLVYTIFVQPFYKN